VPSSTNREIEVKLSVKSLPDIVQRLWRIGAADHGRLFEENTLYDTPDGDFRHHGRLLRLRIETSANGRRRGVLTSKAPVPQARGRRPERASKHKERLEREVIVRDPRRVVGLLAAVGLRPSFCYEKYRTSLRLSGLHLDLDETPVGSFLELEGRPAVIDRVARALGYSPRDYIRGTYWDLYAADCRKRGRPLRNMVFTHRKPRKHAVFP
jgi:adenylate cyclase, class 2